MVLKAGGSGGGAAGATAAGSKEFPAVAANELSENPENAPEIFLPNRLSQLLSAGGAAWTICVWGSVEGDDVTVPICCPGFTAFCQQSMSRNRHNEGSLGAGKAGAFSLFSFVVVKSGKFLPGKFTVLRPSFLSAFLSTLTGSVFFFSSSIKSSSFLMPVD